MIAATTSLTEARNSAWDVVVVGAGPAGSVAAIGLARQGLQVLLVDRSEFPRHKLCGACLNSQSVAGLQALGLTSALQQLNGIDLAQFRLQSAGRKLTLQLPGGLAVSRRSMDAMLVQSAIEEGVQFLPQVSLELLPETSTEMRQLGTNDPNASPIETRVVILATGLGAERLSHDSGLEVVADAGSRIGAGTTTENFPSDYTPGTIFMAVAKQGYVGLTRTEGSVLNIAAALDRSAVRDSSPQDVCWQIIEEARFPATAEMFAGNWRGTSALTRRRKTPGTHRVFVIGDAAGYVEPFTGEGMAWAIRGGHAVIPFARKAVNVWNSDLLKEWTITSQRLIGRGQRLCRALSAILRYPIAVRSLISIVTMLPPLGDAVVRQLNREYHHDMRDSRAGNCRTG